MTETCWPPSCCSVPTQCACSACSSLQRRSTSAVRYVGRELWFLPPASPASPPPSWSTSCWTWWGSRRGLWCLGVSHIRNRNWLSVRLVMQSSVPAVKVWFWIFQFFVSMSELMKFSRPTCQLDYLCPFRQSSPHFGLQSHNSSLLHRHQEDVGDLVFQGYGVS